MTGATTRVFLRSFLVSVLLLSPTGSLIAQADTSRASPPRLLTKRDALLAGGFLAATIAIAPLDRFVAKRLQDSSAQSDAFIRLVSVNVSKAGRPGLLIVGSSLLVVGKVTGQSKLAHFGLHSTEAMLAIEVLNGGLKGVAGRARPKNDIGRPFDFALGRGFGNRDYRSFASTHSASAFAFASVATEEVARQYPHVRWCIRGELCVPPAWVVGVVSYGGASVIGLSRMYNNEHWSSDVMMGAAIGTFTGLKVVQYHHTRPGNRLDRWLLATTITPNPRGGATLAWSAPFPF